MQPATATLGNLEVLPQRLEVVDTGDQRTVFLNGYAAARYACEDKVRHPPRSGWLDELGRLKGGWAKGLGVARCAPHQLLRIVRLLHPLYPVRECMCGPAPVRSLRLRPRNREPRKCSPAKISFLAAQAMRAMAMALFPFRTPITDATGCLGGIAINMCTWSRIKCPSSRTCLSEHSIAKRTAR